MDATDGGRGGLARHKLQDADLATVAADAVGAGELARRVVAALDQDVRQQAAVEALGRGLAERDHPVDGAQRGEHSHARRQWLNRAGVALEAAHRGVVVDGDDEPIAEGAGLLQIGDVAGMEQVESAVGHDDALARRAGA